MKLFCCLTCLLLLRLNVLAEMELRNGIVAIANEAIITAQDVEMASAQVVESAARSYGRSSPQFRQKWNEARNDAVEQLVERQLILADFNTGGRVLPESIIDDRIKDIIRDRYGNRVNLTKNLQAENTTFEVFRQKTRDDLILRIMDAHNVREHILISPAKLGRYYETNLHRYKLNDQVKLRVIVLKRGPGSSPDEVRTLAGEILTKIDGGASFAEMAAIYSDTQRKDSGDWGWFEESKLSKGFAELAASLKPGQHSGVFSLAREEDESYWIFHYDKAGRLIKGRKYTAREVFVEERKFDQPGHDGLPALPLEFYLMQVDEKKSAYTRPLAEMRDEIERELIAQERVRLRKIWIDRLRAKSFVRYF
jgi:peptidyl-prolyl cis-trans isomerase SurA